MAKARIRIQIARFWVGAKPEEVIGLLLPDLAPFYEFDTGGSPDIVLYGPYGGAMPAGKYVRVFVGCENVRPIMSECDWAFGVGHEETEASDRYMRIERWGDDTCLLQEPTDWEEVLSRKSGFCVFLYAHQVPYRETFFRALSRYKPIDAPGRSMNNMPPIDPVPGQFDWNCKIEFLRKYKFVIAFENASFPGYHTEKLTHALQAHTVPIYWGDTTIGRTFNVRRMINAHEYLPAPAQYLPRLPYRPHSIEGAGLTGFPGRIARRWNGECELLEQRVRALKGFERLVEQVMQVDRDDSLYLKCLREPSYPNNRLPDRSRWIERWRRIFESALARERG